MAKTRSRTAERGHRRLMPGPRLRRRLIGGVLVLIGAMVLLAVLGVLYVLTLPPVGDAEARVAAVLAAHGAPDQGPPPPLRLGEAVVAVEDEHFYSNFLVNIFDGAGRAALATLHTSGDPGGSTIAQQLAKQLYPESGGLEGTLHDIGLAVKLSLRYSKHQILVMYLNAVYYGNGYWGERAAAEGYFGVTPGHLSWGEAAMLAGLPQAPSAYDPLHHPAAAKARQDHVLDQLVTNHYITAATARAAKAQVLPFRVHH